MNHKLFSSTAAAVLSTLLASSAWAATAVGTLDGVSADSTFENVGTFGGSVAVTSGAYGWTNLASTARAFRDAVLIDNAALIATGDATGAFAVQFDTHVAIQAATHYTLSVDLGFMTPMDVRSAPYTIELGVLDAGGVFTQLASSQGLAVMGQHFGQGASLTVTAEYLSGTFESGDLTVRLARDAGGNNGRWLGFDNVTLMAAPVPEASSLAMFGVGLAGLMLAARTRRRR